MKAGWKASSLDQLCDVFADGDWIESKDQSPSGIRLIQTGNVGNGVFKDRAEKARYISEDTFRRLRCTEILEGDCLVSRLPDPVGRSCIIPTLTEKCITAVDCTIIRFDRSKIIPELFNYYSQSRDYAAAVAGSVGGATRQRISRKSLGLLSIPLPPLDEQRRIVAVLDKAFAGIATATANAQKNLTNARALFESYLHDILERRGEGWSDQPIASLADTALGKMLDKQKNKGALQPYLRNINVRWFDFDLSDLLEMRFEESEESRYSVRKGDVLICEGGYPGRAAIWTKDETIYYQKALHRVRFKESAMANWFVYLLFYADAVGDLKSHFTGAGIQHFTGQALKKFEIPVPPVNQLASLIAGIDLVFEKTRLAETKYEAKLVALSELKQSLLQKAFAGELT